MAAFSENVLGYFINENIYSYGRGKIYNSLNRLLHEFLRLSLVHNSNSFLLKVNIILLLDELPPQIIPHFITELKETK